MSDFGIIDGFPCAESIGALTGTTSANSVTSGAAWTAGAWVQMTAATTFGYSSITVMIGSVNKSGWLFIDVGVGPAGSEVNVVSGLLIRQQSLPKTNTTTFDLPIKIPAGARVSIRALGEVATMTATVAMIGRRGNTTSYSVAEGLGQVANNTTTLTANVKSNWYQTIASTARPYRALHIDYVLMDHDSGQSNSMLLDVGIGPAGSEVVIVPNLYTSAQNIGGANTFSWQNFFIEGSIPQGTRIAVRIQSLLIGVNKNWSAQICGYF